MLVIVLPSDHYELLMKIKISCDIYIEERSRHLLQSHLNLT